MRVRRRRHLRQMRDAKHLTLGGDLLHLFAHRIGRLAADVRIHLVKDQNGNFIFRRQHGFQGQHHARHFARRRDGAQRPGRFAKVRRELKFNLVEAALFESSSRREEALSFIWFEPRYLGCYGVKRHVKLALLETQIVQLLAHGLGELRNHLLARGGKFFARAQKLHVEFSQRGVKSGKFRVAAFERLQFLFCLVAERDDFGECRAVFALERIDEIEPLLQFHEPRGINIHLVGIARKPGLQLAQCLAHLREQPDQIRRTGIHALQFGQHAANDAGLREQ